ncbi:MAG TPA: hypothetical protein VFJ16_11325 [Longimicrobium sp.]|nr:hypothetical protein [Longimicrobium sp.]
MNFGTIARGALLAAAFGVLPVAVAAQSQPLGQGCVFVSDTTPIPSAAQVADRQKLRLALDSIARANGTPEPAGILYVDVDSTRHGKVFFIESNLSPEGTQLATARVGRYLETLESGRAYQALVRLGTDYIAPAAGKRICAPKLQNIQVLVDQRGLMMEHHPYARSNRPTAERRAVLQLVVSRDGTVPYAELVQPTGDAYVDGRLPAIAQRLRFSPATLDDVPYDVRFRFALPMTVIP